jgi:hypothetical protein
MSDFAKAARAAGVECIATDGVSHKQDKLRQLFAIKSLPQFPGMVVSYTDFLEHSSEVREFFSRYPQGLCVRALPTHEGIRNGLVRRFEYGAHIDQKECLDFLARTTKGNDPSLYDVGLTTWEPQPYGFVIIAGMNNGRFVRGEIAGTLDGLCEGSEYPLASFTTDFAKVGHLEDKTCWNVEENLDAKRWLWYTARQFIMAGDSFQPHVWSGYFEGVITESGPKFLDCDSNFIL